MAPNDPAASDDVKSEHSLVLFFALAYLVSWLIWLPLVASSQGWISASPPFLLFYLGTIGPAAAAVILLGSFEGTEAVWRLLSKLGRWQVGIRWYLIALLLPATIRFAALGVLYGVGSI